LGQRETGAHVALAASEDRCVDGQDQRLVAGRLRALDEILHQASVAPYVDLEPLRPLADGGDLLDRARAQGREAVWDA